MKTTCALVLISAISATAFAPPSAYQQRTAAVSSLSAKSKEEDLELTRKVIADFYGTGGDDEPAAAPAAAPAETEEKPKKAKKSKK